jgi:hypothetical protein
MVNAARGMTKSRCLMGGMMCRVRLEEDTTSHWDKCKEASWNYDCLMEAKSGRQQFGRSTKV